MIASGERSSAAARQVVIALDEPPTVAGLGVGLHGVTRLIDRYTLPDLWSLHLYSYEARLLIDDVRYTIKPGSLTLVPPAAVMEWHYLGPSEHLYVHLAADGGYAVQAAGSRAQRRVHVQRELGAALPGIRDLMLSAIGHFAANPARTRADIWTVLLELVQLRPASQHNDDVAHHYVAVAMSFIENNLAESITVPDIARAAGISHNHLTRLFKAETGTTVIGHLRTRRIARATHLLRRSTMSVSAVAASVGIPDLQAFNKACRAETGLSPRQLRTDEG